MSHFSLPILNVSYLLGVGERQDKTLWGFGGVFLSKTTPILTLELKRISSYFFIELKSLFLPILLHKFSVRPQQLFLYTF